MTPPSAPLLAVDRSWEAALPRPPRPGGFDWWYADGRDERGDGLVFIWASRLPFFAAARPSINLALYRGGRPEFWLLQQPPRAAWSERVSGRSFALTLEGEEGRRSTLSVRAANGEFSLDASLDLSLPRDSRRLQGTLCWRGPSALLAGPPDARAAAHPHRWVPLAPVARCSARLSLGGAPLFDWDGPGYADRNLGDAPLASLGLRRWAWGRARSGDRCLAYYLLEGTDGDQQAVTLDAVGGPRPTCSVLAAPGFTATRRELVVHSEAQGGALRIERGAAVERSPFYLRSFGLLAEPGGPSLPTIHERCEVASVGATWHRPLVRMRLHQPDGGNSLFAPLFTGPRQGRMRRLLGLGARP